MFYFSKIEVNLQTKKEEVERKILFDKIKSIVVRKFSDANLSLFGSSNNGFGMKKSDLDICMTFDRNANDEEVKYLFLLYLCIFFIFCYFRNYRH